jgi:hypothetical protein
MPLRDHFRSPVNDTHSWDEVHGQWPGEIVRHLTTILPAGFRAAPKLHLGSPFEVDVSTYHLDSRNPDTNADSGDGGTGTLTALSPTLTVEADLSEQDEYEVRVYDAVRGRQLVAAIEVARRLVLPHDRRTTATDTTDLAHPRPPRNAPARDQLRRNLSNTRDCVKRFPSPTRVDDCPQEGWRIGSAWPEPPTNF